MIFGKRYELNANTFFRLKNMNNNKPAQILVNIHKHKK